MGQVPDGAAVIAVNYAVTAPVPVSHHFVDSHVAAQADWWRDWPPEIERIYSRDLVMKAGLRADYMFDRKPPLTVNNFQPIRGVVRTGGSGIGGALQVCWQCCPPAASINVIGADQFGNEYFDGRRVPEYNIDHWRVFRPKLERLIGWLRTSGMRIEFVTPTSLTI
jgi:hypothetical protein